MTAARRRTRPPTPPSAPVDGHVADPILPAGAFEPVILEGRFVRLEPLTLAHVEPLVAVGLDPELWRWIPWPVRTAGDMRAYVEAALAMQAAGTGLPFATIELASGRVVGSTRFGNIDRPDRRAEIGWTWLAPPWQRTRLNSEAKLLMLEHAFERLGCVRVEFKTDSLNEKSRAALLRIGAREEGIFRNHMLTWSGRLRHSAYYSVIAEEWPAVKAALVEGLSRGS